MFYLLILIITTYFTVVVEHNLRTTFPTLTELRADYTGSDRPAIGCSSAPGENRQRRHRGKKRGRCTTKEHSIQKFFFFSVHGNNSTSRPVGSAAVCESLAHKLSREEQTNVDADSRS